MSYSALKNTMYVLFDIGGTKTRLAISKNGQDLKNITILPTSQNFRDGIAAMADFIKQNKLPVTAIAGGIAGPLNKEKSMIINAPNIKDWNNKPLKKQLEETFNAPVYLENDTAMIGIGEATAGAGKGHSIVAYLTISTGIGGSRIVNGELDRNSLGFEPGHQIITANDSVCACGGIGHLEALVSGTALTKKYNLPPEKITDPDVWEDTALWLAKGLNNTLVYWSPDIVVLGGSLMNKITVDRVIYHLKSLTTIFPQLPVIKKAALDNIGGLHGSLLYAAKRHPL